MATLPRTLDQLLAESVTSDFWEEDAIEYLEDRRIAPVSHSRRAILTQAWNRGWRPAFS
jgi:hypothetical protein